MVSFPANFVNKFPDGWGPPPDAQVELPVGSCDFVEHLDKFKLTRVGICDISESGQKYQQERGKGKGAKGFGKGKGPQPLAPGKDDEGFSLVDSRPPPGKSAGRGRGGSYGRGKGGRKGSQPPVNYQQGILNHKPKPSYYQASQPKGRGKGGKGGPQRRGTPSFKEPSVQTKTEWTMMREIMLTSLGKLVLDAREVKYEDLAWCGKLHCYNKDFDKITVKTEKPLRQFKDVNFYNVGSSEDETLRSLLQSDPSVTVIGTDLVLACLIAASRSVYSWDITVLKKTTGSGVKLMFDKRPGSVIEYFSVNENAKDPPNADEKESINSPVKLSHEASCINQNFTQMVLDQRIEPEEMEQPNPFEDEDEGPVASGAYRYRKITLPGNPKAESAFEQKPISMIVRTEVNCKLPEDKGLVSVKALNEYEPKISTAWRTHLEGQRGACLATEVENNAFKLGRWTAQAILAGCNFLKLGFVSRADPGDVRKHTVLGVQTHATDNFAAQIGLNQNNMYGILRNIINEIAQWKDGNYLLLKDPLKPVLRIFEVPADAFAEEEDDEEEEGEEEDHEVDEDGNVAPQQPE